jgi:hypothetical protein
LVARVVNLAAVKNGEPRFVDGCRTNLVSPAISTAHAGSPEFGPSVIAAFNQANLSCGALGSQTFQDPLAELHRFQKADRQLRCQATAGSLLGSHPHRLDIRFHAVNPIGIGPSSQEVQELFVTFDILFALPPGLFVDQFDLGRSK